MFLYNQNTSNSFSNAMVKRAQDSGYRQDNSPKRIMQEERGPPQFQAISVPAGLYFYFISFFSLKTILFGLQVQIPAPQLEDYCPCTQRVEFVHKTVITVTFLLIFKILCEKLLFSLLPFPVHRICGTPDNLTSSCLFFFFLSHLNTKWQFLMI